eukprot:12882686-Prorocentrum_lima.AAC.1
MASDWVSAIGGTKAGVYLLYGHPGCDWQFTLSNPHNQARFPGCTAADFKGKKASTHSMPVIGGFLCQKAALSSTTKVTSHAPRRASI